jgi:cob(I)alamin adenosyltransferase
MSGFYTRTGDDGFTGLLGNQRVPKYDPQPEALGAIDEVSAVIGIARNLSQSAEVRSTLKKIQSDLYSMMSEIAATPENAQCFRVIGESQITWLEDQINHFSQQVQIPREFILPGDTFPGAVLDQARTVARRAERRTAEVLHRQLISNPFLLGYLNRLSSLLFVVELVENQLGGVDSPTLVKDIL